MKPLSTGALARASARHPWRVLALWLAILVLAVVAASGLGDALTSSTNFTNKPESQVGADLLGMNGGIKSAPTYYQAQAAGEPSARSMVSADHHTTIIPVTFIGDNDQASKQVDAYVATIAREGGNGIRVLTVGDLSSNKAFNNISSEDLHQSETLTMPLTILILIVVFGALVAVGVPLVLAITSIIVALGLTAIVGRFTDLSFYVVT